MIDIITDEDNKIYDEAMHYPMVPNTEIELLDNSILLSFDDKELRAETENYVSYGDYAEKWESFKKKMNEKYKVYLASVCYSKLKGHRVYDITGYDQRHNYINLMYIEDIMLEILTFCYEPVYEIPCSSPYTTPSYLLQKLSEKMDFDEAKDILTILLMGINVSNEEEYE